MSLDSEIGDILERAKAAVADSPDLAALDHVRVAMLGKKGELTALLKGLGALAADERPQAGAKINEAKTVVQDLIEGRKEALEQAQLSQALAEEEVDVTLPGRAPEGGGLHPVTQAMQRIAVFVKTGSQTNRIGERDPHQLNRIVHHRCFGEDRQW